MIGEKGEASGQQGGSHKGWGSRQDKIQVMYVLTVGITFILCIIDLDGWHDCLIVDELNELSS